MSAISAPLRSLFQKSFASTGKGPTILATGVAGGLLLLPFVALEEEHYHPSSTAAKKLQRFKSQTCPANPWSVEYPDDNHKDLAHGHELHEHMKDGPAKWHKGLQRWHTQQ